MLKQRFAIMMGKLYFKACRLMHKGGTANPGMFAKKFDPDILKHLSKDVDTVIVTGSNGKTTTVNMIASAFEAAGVPCFANKLGANMEGGIITSFLLNSDLSGKPKKKTAVMECDEGYFAKMCAILTPGNIVITLLCKDQADRMEDPEKLYQLFMGYMKDCDSKICINKDCPVTSKALNELSGKKLYAYCVRDGKLSINDTLYDVEHNIPGEYNYYNMAAAFAVMESRGLLNDNVKKALENFRLPFGRMEKFYVDDTETIMNLAKNVVGYDGVLKYLCSADKKYKVVFGINANEGDGFDRTWIDEIGALEYRAALDDTVACGDCVNEVAKMLENAGCKPEKAGSYEELLSIIKHSEKPVFLILNYTYMMNARAFFAKEGYLKDFWA